MEDGEEVCVCGRDGGGGLGLCVARAKKKGSRDTQILSVWSEWRERGAGLPAYGGWRGLEFARNRLY